ncbi:class I SAM-dependent methyltransferase [Thermodesulfobacteriota bacterium]
MKHRIVKLQQTPHYQFIKGNKKPYQEYLEKFGESVGFGIEHSEGAFAALLESQERYLGEHYRSNYIVCFEKQNLFGKKSILLDGVHRACLLLHQGVSEIPVAFLLDKNCRPSQADQLTHYLSDYKNTFLEWYTPINIGSHIIHERTYPHFKERPEFLSNRERGKSKWDYIIKKNLPNIAGKTICDIGCNIGLYSLFLSRLGAKKVDGFDRSTYVIQPTNPKLPRQNVIQQAYFVKNLFHLSGDPTEGQVHFVECDIAELDFSALTYDLLFSCCVLYHFGRQFEVFIKEASQNIPEIFLQTNLGHTQGDLGKYASISYHEELLQKYGYETKVDAPEGYNYPVIYGKRSS